MCGIVGIVASSPGGPLPGEDVAGWMNSTIRHRGPDDEGVFRDSQALLGMRRLSIIDVAGGHQPVTNEDRTVHAVFNGEIYNYRELRTELLARDHKFTSHSDAEVIVHAYEEWGESSFERFHGMFAIALWDARRRVLLLARDRFGEKPLFYAEEPTRLLFGSELKALRPVPGFSAELDLASIRAYMTFGWIPAPASVFHGVQKLLPGHYLRYADGQVSTHRYYALDFRTIGGRTESEAEEQLAKLLEQAVSSRLVSDVPFGAFLSGGLDSSVVVALMSKHMRQPVLTFSIGFRESSHNELEDARRVATLLGTDHHELVVEPDAVELLREIVWYLDEPFADPSAIPTFLVARLARAHVKMVLTGDGGDEAFAGYDRYLRYLRLQALGSLKPLAARAAGIAGTVLPGSSGYRLRRVAERLRQPFPDSYLSGLALTRPDVAAQLLGDALRDAGGSHYESLYPASAEISALGPLNRVVAIDFASYLPDDILVKLDRMGMANSIEGRSPLLDHRLVEFAVGLPPNLRIRDGRGKYLLRKVAARWLPPDVLQKRKQGFGMPLGQWFRGPLRALASETFSSRAFRERGLVRASAAERVLSDHLAGLADHGQLLWLIVSLELWARRCLDGREG